MKRTEKQSLEANATDLKWFGLLVDLEMTLKVGAGHKCKSTLKVRAHKGTFTTVRHQVPLQIEKESCSSKERMLAEKNGSTGLQPSNAIDE